LVDKATKENFSQYLLLSRMLKSHVTDNMCKRTEATDGKSPHCKHSVQHRVSIDGLADTVLILLDSADIISDDDWATSESAAASHTPHIAQQIRCQLLIYSRCQLVAVVVSILWTTIHKWTVNITGHLRTKQAAQIHRHLLIEHTTGW